MPTLVFITGGGAVSTKILGSVSSTVVIALTTATLGQIVRYDPTAGTFTINAPAAPATGDKFGVKNQSADLTAITINGNGNMIENPLASFALLASFATFSGDGIAVEWVFDGTEWLAI